MTDTEMRELDVWIDLNIFNSTPSGKRFSTDPAASFELLKKLSEDHDIVVHRGSGRAGGEEWYIHKLTAYGSLDYTTGANTLELAIALFARKLYSK